MEKVKSNNSESVGISYLGVEAPYTTVSTDELAKAINQDPEKIRKGLGVNSLKWPTYSQNNSTMAAQALYNFIRKLRDDSELNHQFLANPPQRIFYSTESNSDQSRPDMMSALRMVYNKLLDDDSENKKYIDIFRRCDVMQVTFACAGGGLSLGSALDHVKANEGSSAIVISADTSVYDSSRAPNAEATQGSAATIMWVTQSPRLLNLNESARTGSSNLPVSDFTKFGDHRPLVYGKFSEIMYIYLAAHAFEEVEDSYTKANGHTILDHTDFMVTHVPFPKQAIYYNSALFAHYLRLNGQESLKSAITSREEVGKCPTNGARFTTTVSEIIDGQRNAPESKLVPAIEANPLLKDYMDWLKRLRGQPEAKGFAKKLHIEESLKIPSLTGNSYSSAAIVGLASTLSNANLDKVRRGLVVFYGSGAISRVVPLDVVAAESEKGRYMNINIGTPEEVVALTAEQYKEIHEVLLKGEAKRVMPVGKDLYEEDMRFLRGRVPRGFHVRKYGEDGTSEAFYL